MPYLPQPHLPYLPHQPHLPYLPYLPYLTHYCPAVGFFAPAGLSSSFCTRQFSSSAT